MKLLLWLLPPYWGYKAAKTLLTEFDSRVLNKLFSVPDFDFNFDFNKKEENERVSEVSCKGRLLTSEPVEH